MQKLYAWAIVLLVSIGQLYAQQARIIYTPTTTPGARMAASDSPIIGIQGQQIGTTMKLRWIPANDSTGTIWQQGITNGYIVKRKITYRNGSPVANATFQTLATVKPADQNSSVWSDTNADNATYHDAAKKLLYAYEDMALKDRYPYFIWVTTYSYAAAVKGGVGYIDNSLQTGDSCVYTVEIANTSIKSSELFNRQALRAIPAPATPGVKFLPRALDDSAKNANQRYVRIESKIDTSRTDYVAYSIERSVNNSAFSRINPELIILFNTDNKSKTELTYNDTIPNNRSTYSYRIIGKTIFDENITSVTQTQTAKLPLSVTPVMDSVKVFDNRAANLYWHYINNQGVSIAQSSDIGAQIIQYSRKADLGFGKDMTVTSLSSTDRIKQSLLQYDNQYYRIGAIGIDGDTLFSRAMLGQYVDKIPPKSPASVLVKWNNSEKKPEISWASNQEEDLAGYRVYRKNSDAEQPVQITPFVYVGTPYPGRTTYQDTTTFRVAGMVLKYFVAAEDKKGNLSGRSELMSVVVPDMAKPSPAIFISDSINTSKPFIYLNWRNSPSADVRKHTLYRAELPDGTFFTKLTYTNLINEYIDNDVAFGKRYVYSIIAEDTTLLSMSSTPRIIQMPNAPAEPFTSFKAQYQLSTKSINLDWQYPSPDQVASYEIYRAEGGASIPTTWALVSAPSAGTQDASVKVGTGYKYQIRAILKSGALTSWTNLEILFPDNLCIDGQASISNKGVAAATTITKQEACEEVILEPGFEARPQTSGSYEATIKK